MSVKSLTVDTKWVVGGKKNSPRPASYPTCSWSEYGPSVIFIIWIRSSISLKIEGSTRSIFGRSLELSSGASLTGVCSAKGDPWFSGAGVGAKLKVRSYPRPTPRTGAGKGSEVKASGLVGSSGEAENPVKIKLPRASATN